MGGVEGMGGDGDEGGSGGKWGSPLEPGGGSPGAKVEPGGSPGTKKKLILINILVSQCKNIDIARFGKLQQCKLLKIYVSGKSDSFEMIFFGFPTVLAKCFQ